LFDKFVRKSIEKIVKKSAPTKERVLIRSTKSQSSKMTSGDEWFNETNVVKEEGENEESLLVDVESHEDVPNMKRESEDLSFSNQVLKPLKKANSRPF